MQELVTVFCQGNSTARSQAAKYAGAHGVHYRYDETAQTQAREHAVVPKSLCFLPALYAWRDLDDVGYGWPRPWWNVLLWLSLIKSWLTLWWFGIKGASHTYVRYAQMNVAGERDVAQYLAAVRRCAKDEPQKRLVLFGCSRGAATVLVALRHLSKAERGRVALVLVEAPFDSLPNVFCSWYGLFWGKLALRVFAWFTAFREAQESPLHAVQHQDFPLDVPLAFVYSRTDTMVPPRHTEALIQALRERGPRALEVLCLAQSHHSAMPCGPEACDYLAFTRTLYEKYQ